jgi:hypothetical protein
MSDPEVPGPIPEDPEADQDPGGPSLTMLYCLIALALALAIGIAIMIVIPFHHRR